MEKKKSFILYVSFYEPLKSLSDEQLGRLLRAIFNYEISGDTNVDADINIAFLFVKNQLDVDNEKYKKTVEKNRANGSKGGRPKKSKTQNNPEKPNGFFENPKKPIMIHDNDNDNDNDNDTKNNKLFLVKESKEKISCYSFEEFWEDYGKKVEMKKCKVKWSSLTEAKKEKIKSHVKGYVLSTPEKQFRKNPSTYLNNESWNDENIPSELSPTIFRNENQMFNKENIL